MSGSNTRWCLSLGNYGSGTRTLRGVAPRGVAATAPQRMFSMAFKSPRSPNPNLALLQRQRVCATAPARGVSFARAPTVTDPHTADVNTRSLRQAGNGPSPGAPRNRS